MRLSFKDVEDRHKGSPAFVAAHGPSLNPYLCKLPELKQAGYIIIGCNEWYTFHEACPPQYYVLANTVYTMSRQISVINRYNLTPVFASSVDPTDFNWIEKNTNRDFLPYRQHMNGPEVQSIQEALCKHTNQTEWYGSGDTVALHMIALAIILGCNPIYIAGVDLDYTLGYAQHSKPQEFVVGNEIGAMNNYLDRNLKNLSIIYAAAKNVGVGIYNLNPKPSYDTIPIGSLDQNRLETTS
jgi:hypothetical protein